jgi:translation initiation factor SUI1
MVYRIIIDRDCFIPKIKLFIKLIIYSHLEKRIKLFFKSKVIMELEQTSQNENVTFNPFGTNAGLLSSNNMVQTSNIVSSANFKGEIDIKIKSRTKRKFCTTITGLHNSDLDLDKLAGKWRKMYSCSAAYDKDDNGGNGSIKIAGDRRESILEYLTENNIATKEQIRVHGY